MPGTPPAAFSLWLKLSFIAVKILKVRNCKDKQSSRHNTKKGHRISAAAINFTFPLSCRARSTYGSLLPEGRKNVETSHLCGTAAWRSHLNHHRSVNHLWGAQFLCGSVFFVSKLTFNKTTKT
jgi:hypothetical protein